MEANASQVNDSSQQVPLLSSATVKSEGHAKECHVPNHDYSTCTFLQILAKEKSIDVECERLLIACPNNNIKWSEYLGKMCQFFPGILKCNHVCDVSFLKVSSLL